MNKGIKQAAREAGVYWGVPLKAQPKRRLGGGQKRRNRKMSTIRSRVEYVFGVLKRQSSYAQVRYLGLAKNAAQVFPLIAVTNLYLKRRQLMA